MKRNYLTISILSAMLVGCGAENAAEPTPPPAPSVKVIVADATPITPYLNFIGRTKASHQIDLIPRVEGELVAQHFNEGEYVEQGQLLYEIDPRPYQVALDAATAKLAEAKARQSIAIRNAERAEKLIGDKSISEQQYDAVMGEKRASEANVLKSLADVESAMLNLQFTNVYAPFKGRIGFSDYQVGDRVTTVVKNRLATLVQVDPFRFEFDVDEKLYRRVRSAIDTSRQHEKEIKAGFWLTLSDGSQYQQEGQIYAVGNQIDSTTGAIKAQASFPNPDLSILPGEYGELTIKLKNDTVDGILVPGSIILQDQAGDYVMTVNTENKVEKRYVELGQEYAGGRHVLKGLEEGDSVISQGMQKVRQGIAVNIDSSTE